MDILFILAKLFNARCAVFRVRLFRRFRISLNSPGFSTRLWKLQIH